MKLVILGAGASYDSYFWYKNQDTFNGWRPPLANEIFDTRPEFNDIIEEYPSAATVFSEFSTLGDLEDFFQKKYESSIKHDSIEIEKTLINLRFYLQHLFYVISDRMKKAGFSNIDKLVNHIHEYVIRTGEDVLIVNFNYDLLVEQSLRNHYYSSSSTNYEMNDYLSHKIKLIKPHGSCNWFSPLVANSFILRQGERLWQHLLSNDIKQETINRNLKSEFKVAAYNTEYVKSVIQDHQQYLAFPQIFIPLKEKDDFCMPKEQTDYLMQYLPNVDDILIVGWKGYEAHFNGILKESLKGKKVNIQVVNGIHSGGDDTTKKNLVKYIDTSNYALFTSHINVNMIKQKENVRNDIYRYVQPGSFSSFFLNMENGNIKSIFG